MTDRRLERVLPVERWPTREEAASMRWFSPVRIGAVEALARTWVPAMVPWRATEDGFVTPEVLEWYARFAQGEPGVIVVEATGIRDIPSGPLLRIGHDRYIDGLRELVDRVRAASGGRTRLFIQLIDFLNIRRRPMPEKYFGRYLKVDDALRERAVAYFTDEAWRAMSDPEVRDALATLGPEAQAEILGPREWESLTRGYRERVTDTHLPYIRDLPEQLPGLFADAAERARAAGFDGVELHYAHAYTMASFLSALNTRTDGYGGARANRARLPLEVYRAVRKRVGADYTVGGRFLGDDVVEGGSRLDDATYFGVSLRARALIF